MENTVATKIIQDFELLEVEKGWKNSLAESPLSEADQEKILNDIRGHWNSVSDVSNTLFEEAEIHQAIYKKYIELKSSWLLLNTIIQYKTLVTGEFDNYESYRASLLSQLVSFLENYLEEKEVRLINKLLSEPIRNEFFSDPAELIAQNESMDNQLQDLYQQRDQLFAEIGTAEPEAIISMIQSMDAQLNSLYADVEDSGAPSGTSDARQTLNQLEQSVGTSDPNQISMMIQSLEEQLNSLYAELEESTIIDSGTVTITSPRRIVIRKRA
jgi:hypothetical protein